MRLGISSYTYGWNVAERKLSAMDLIDRAKQFGVAVLQICDNLPPETYEDTSLHAIERRAEESAIDLELGTRGCRPEHLRRFIALAQSLNSSIIRLVIDDAEDHPSEAEVIERLRQVRSDLEAADVTVGIENHDRFKAASLVRIIQGVGTPKVGITLDTVNSFGALEGPDLVVNALGPHVVNLHLKDFAVHRVPYLQGFVVEGRPAGEGMLDVLWVLAKLKEFGRDCNAIAELWVPPEASMDKTLAKEMDWAERSVRTLREWIKD